MPHLSNHQIILSTSSGSFGCGPCRGSGVLLRLLFFVCRLHLTVGWFDFEVLVPWIFSFSILHRNGDSQCLMFDAKIKYFVFDGLVKYFCWRSVFGLTLLWQKQLHYIRQQNVILIYVSVSSDLTSSFWYSRDIHVNQQSVKKIR